MWGRQNRGFLPPSSRGFLLPPSRGSLPAREWAHGLIALILGLSLLGVGSNLGISKRAVDFLGAVLSIPEYPAVVLREAFQGARQWGQDRTELQEELERLRDENARLRLKETALEGASPGMARVTLRAPMSWWNEVRIDKGEHDGARVGMPVFHEGWLLGRVTSVSLLSSWVELLTSPSLMIPVVVEETRDLGVVVGDGEGSVFLRYIPAGRGVAVGQTVSTAFVGEQLPPGLPVGKIVEELSASGSQGSGSAGDGYAVYRIEPGANLSRFSSVSLLLPAQGSGEGRP